MSELSKQRICQEGACAVIEWDLRAGVLAVNDDALTLFGVRLKALDGEGFLQWLASGLNDTEANRLRGKIHANENVSAYYSEQNGGAGVPVSCEWRHVVMADAAGNRSIVSIGKDLSRQKIADEMLKTLVAGSLPAGKEVLCFIVKNLARILSVRHCLLVVNDEIGPQRKIVLAGWSDGRKIKRCSWFSKAHGEDFIHDGVIDIDKKPCQELLKATALTAGFCYGIQLHNQDSESGEWLFLLDDQAIDIPEEARFLLETLLSRISVEIAQYRKEKKLVLAARIFSETHEAIMVTDSDGIIVDVNPAACQMSGYGREELIGVNSSILKSGLQSEEFYRELWRALITKGVWQGEFWNRRKNGDLYAEHKTITRLVAENDDAVYYVGLGSDITEQKRQQQVLEKMAHFDVLTQLPNRALFADRLRQAMACCKREQSLLAVCFVDLDQFKPINDAYGHQVGDQILIEVSSRMITTVREQDTVARLSGDEFALLLSHLDSPEQCERIMYRFHQELSKPFYVNDEEIFLSASSGITLYPQDNVEPEMLLRHADSAMYQAKLKGRNQFAFFDSSEAQKISQHHKRINKISKAFEKGEFCLFYQPKLNVSTGKVFGVEALIRWISPDAGLIPPLEFLPSLDGTELEIEVGDWVLEQAWRQVAQWFRQGRMMEVSVNISAMHLQNPGFYDRLSYILAKHPAVPAALLQLEVLESSTLGDVHVMRELIKKCRDGLGVGIALDDFGTGYSSLTHLRRLPVNCVKIDKSFVIDMLQDENDYAIVKSVISLAKVFRREVIAEGVESIEHGKKLYQMGCENLQGYGIAKPMPLDQLAEWLLDDQWLKDWCWLD